MDDFGKCEECNVDIKAVYYTEHEYYNHLKTGRTKVTCDYLICPMCLSTTTVDDSFDGPWERK